MNEKMNTQEQMIFHTYEHKNPIIDDHDSK